MNEQRVLSGFDMQGQVIKDVELKEVTIEDIGQTLPSASDYPNRVLIYNGEIVYSNGVKWIGQEELVTAGLKITNVGDGKITINGTEYTIYTLPSITNAMQATMPAKTFKGNVSASASKPADLTSLQVASAIKSDLKLDVTVTESNGYYVIKQGGVEIGKLRIDRVVQSGGMVNGTWTNGAFTESTSGAAQALKLVLNTRDAIYINVSKLIDVYRTTNSDTIELSIDANNNITAKVKDGSIGWEQLNTDVTISIQDLGNKVSALERDNVNADWNETDSTKKSFIQNKPSLNQVKLVVTAGGTEVGSGKVYSPSNENIVVKLAKVSQSGSYTDLSNKPTIPQVNNPTITIKNEAGNTLGSFSLNQTTNQTITVTTVDKPCVVTGVTGQTGIILESQHQCGKYPDAEMYLDGEKVICKFSHNNAGDLTWHSGIVLTESSKAIIKIWGSRYSRIIDLSVNITSE